MITYTNMTEERIKHRGQSLRAKGSQRWITGGGWGWHRWSSVRGGWCGDPAHAAAATSWTRRLREVEFALMVIGKRSFVAGVSLRRLGMGRRGSCRSRLPPRSIFVVAAGCSKMCGELACCKLSASLQRHAGILLGAKTS
jgi:hypothetical protein